MEQTHSSTGDNVAGNKIIQNTSSSKTILTSVSTKISEYEEYGKLNYEDDNFIKALKEVITDIIKEEEEKCHGIVPISQIRNRFENQIQDENFNKVLKELFEEQKVYISDVQVCYIPKNLNYKITI